MVSSSGCNHRLDRCLLNVLRGCHSLNGHLLNVLWCGSDCCYLWGCHSLNRRLLNILWSSSNCLCNPWGCRSLDRCLLHVSRGHHSLGSLRDGRSCSSSGDGRRCHAGESWCRRHGGDSSSRCLRSSKDLGCCNAHSGSSNISTTHRGGSRTVHCRHDRCSGNCCRSRPKS